MDKSFKKAFDNLKRVDASIVKECISRRCKWKSPASFYMKMNGERPLYELNEAKKREIAIIESTFRNFGIDAWTGEPLEKIEA